MIEKWTKKSKKVPKSFFSFRAHNFFLDHHIGLETSEIESTGFLDELKKKSHRKKNNFFLSKKKSQIFFVEEIFHQNQLLAMLVVQNQY